MIAIFIHGAGGGAWEWNVWRRVFEASGLDTTALELQPRGEALAATRWPDYLAQVVEAARAPNASCALIGASLGGLLALAAAAPCRAEALVLVNPLPPAPLSTRLPARPRVPAVIPWRQRASLCGTRTAMPDADAATCVYAFRRWRDESGAVVNEARDGIEISPPSCPILVIASSQDQEVPVDMSQSLAERLGARLEVVDDSHVGPLLGRHASRRAALTVRWLNAVGKFRGD